MREEDHVIEKGQLTLDSWRPDLNDLGGFALILTAEAVDKRAECRLGGRVRGHGNGGNQSDETAGENQGSGERLLQQAGEELQRQIYERSEVGVDLSVEGTKVDLGGPG